MYLFIILISLVNSYNHTQGTEIHGNVLNVAEVSYKFVFSKVIVKYRFSSLGLYNNVLESYIIK